MSEFPLDSQPGSESSLTPPDVQTPTVEPRAGWFSRVLVYLVLAIAVSTVSVAYAAPQVLEPIATSLPEGWFPSVNAPPKSFHPGSC